MLQGQQRTVREIYTNGFRNRERPPYTSARAVHTTRPRITASSGKPIAYRAGWLLMSSQPPSSHIAARILANLRRPPLWRPPPRQAARYSPLMPSGDRRPAEGDARPGAGHPAHQPPRADNPGPGNVAAMPRTVPAGHYTRTTRCPATRTNADVALFPKSVIDPG